jgi:D-beta-D-heptose 7-phosphate kinase/D-beta-D-heptose 1-phosphate adenosyltransferase
VSPLAPSRAAALVAAMRGRRIVVVGDVMLDEFLWGRVSRISPEAPVPVVEVTRQSFHLGGAGNVAANVRALGGEATLVGLVGQDAAGASVAAALSEAGVQPRLVVSEGGRPTTVKTRIVAHHQQVVRADREESGDVEGAAGAAILEALREALAGCDALVVSDYQKGVVTPALLRRALPLARRRRIPVLVDPKLRRFPLYRGVTVVTPNQLEAEQATGLRLRDERTLAAAGRRILSLLSCRAALVTRKILAGVTRAARRGGMSAVCDMPRGIKGERPVRFGFDLHVEAAAREVFDVTGAGDSVIATMALALAAGASLAEAAMLANEAAGVVVGKLGTAQASPAELLASVRLAARRRPRRAAPRSR